MSNVSSERRSLSRRRSLLRGLVVYGANNEFSVHCAIHNISPTGARISTKNGVLAPRHFYLFDPKNASVHMSEVVNVSTARGTTYLGVKFSGTIPIRRGQVAETGPQSLNRYLRVGTGDLVE